MGARTVLIKRQFLVADAHQTMAKRTSHTSRCARVLWIRSDPKSIMRSVSSLYPYIYYICMSLVHLARLSYATIVPIAFRPVNYYPFRICCGQALSFGCLATYPFKCLLLGHALEIGRFAVKRRCCKVFGACSPHKLIFVSVEIWFPLFLGFL